MATKVSVSSDAVLSPRDTIILRDMVENMQYMVRILDARQNVVYMNRQMREQFSDLDGTACFDIFRQTAKCENCISSRAWTSGRTEEKDMKCDGRFFKLMSSPVLLTTGERFSIEIFYDITEQKNIELELVSHYKTLTAELNIARNIQKGILPKDGIYWNTIKLSSLYLPTEVLGGDLYDIIRVNRDNILMYIADVSGHGVHASMITMFVREVIRGNLSEAAKGLNCLLDTIMEGYMTLDVDPEIYFSVLLCSYNKTSRELTAINAGHNCYPLIARKKGGVEEIAVNGPPISRLGRFLPNQEMKVPLKRGDRLVLHTDGITEEFNILEQKAFGVEGVKRILRENCGTEGKDLARLIVNAANDFSTDKMKDDRAIMIADVV
ncbi:MAG: serine/threonine-protein phosphatase [Clostridiales Family XIII bacterium]|jgi:sigma-B regulation protein RsbU (phosphoserine phosphatase)|nr:serine/threonine-protein phosphatase [Clostridiales Family XIII bacterium]